MNRSPQKKPYYTFCGPAVISSVLHIPRVEAARRLEQEGGGWDGRSTRLSQLVAVVRLSGAFSDWSSSREVVLPTAGAGWNRSHMTRRCQTLVQWLAVHRTGNYIVRAGYHFVHIEHGTVMEDNSRPSRRARITHEIHLIAKEGSCH